MTTVTWTKTNRTVVSSSTNTAGSTTRGTVDLRTAGGGRLTGKITNGGTGPTLPCEMRVLVAHTTGTTPTAASEGTDWKTIATFVASTTANAVAPFSLIVDPGVMHLEVEFTGNTGQSVTVEAFLSEITSLTGA